MIPGFFAPQILPQPLIRLAVIVAEFPAAPAALVPFVIDTGAALTTIHAMDAIRFFGATPAELDSSTWTNARPMGGIGGDIQCKPSAAQFGFKQFDGSLLVIDDEVLIGDMKSASTPSLLGWNLLKYFKLTVDGADSVVLEPRPGIPAIQLPG